VRADEKLTAFVELEAAIRAGNHPRLKIWEIIADRSEPPSATLCLPTVAAEHKPATRKHTVPPIDYRLGPLLAQMPDAHVAESISLNNLQERWIAESGLILLDDPDRPTPPIVLTAGQTYVHGESGIGVLKPHSPSRVDPLGRDEFNRIDTAGGGIVEFGSYHYDPGIPEDNIPGIEETDVAPNEDAKVQVLFLPAVLHRVYLCRFFLCVHEEQPFAIVVSSSSGAEQTFPVASSPENPVTAPFSIVVPVDVTQQTWHDLHFSLSEQFAWTFFRCEVSKTTTPS
jgi:hypothetical protein